MGHKEREEHQEFTFVVAYDPAMTIVVAGGTGFLGSALVAALRIDGHRVLVLTRHPRHTDDHSWSPGDVTSNGWMSVVDDADAVVNLAGESIAGGRWTAARQRAIRASRVQATKALVTAIKAATTRPRIFISGSAIGFYGNRGDERLTEDSAPGSDFLADVCREWERLAFEAAPVSRVVCLRTGLVLARRGGALPQLALPFRLFVGGPAGSGRQYMSWIHVDDWVAMVLWAINNTALTGAINLTAPAPVTNAVFSKALGRALWRPAIMPAPAFALRLVLGEMADALILGGQRVLPARAESMGFAFKYADIDSALYAAYG
jgi:uncharacterized protein (TIGR01777 family)